MGSGLFARWVGCAWLVVAPLAAVPAVALAGDPVVVGIHDAPPFAYFDEAGNAQGFAIDVFESIARERGWEVRYVDGTWESGLEAAALGQVDLLVPVDASQERGIELDFGQESLITSWGQVFAAKANRYDNVTALEGARVAVVDSDAFGSELVDRLDRFEVEVQVVAFDDVGAAFAGVQRGAADVAAVERLDGGLRAAKFGLAGTPIVFHPTAARFAATPNAPPGLLAAIDEELAIQKGDPNSSYANALSRWFAPPTETRVPDWVLGLLGVLGAGLVLALLVVRVYRARVGAATQEIRQRNDQLRREIADRESAEEQLRQAQKMEAVGHLSAGLAHDFNNLLSVIYGYAETLEESNDEMAREAAEAIGGAARRAGKLTRQLVAMASRQTFKLEAVQANELLSELGPLLRGALRDDVELELDLDAGLPPIEVDKGQIEQVLLNLAVNAGHAMPQGGRLKISTREIQVDAARGLPNVGPHVELRVVDTGTGMDAATRERIFDPFFSTKGPSKGTGLGLAVAYGIVRQSGGEISVWSEPGQGSRFTVVLPCAAEAANSGVVCEAASPEVEKPSLGPLTVLFVEDNAELRAATTRRLRTAGLDVLLARDGFEALELVRGRCEDIALVVSDVVMPGMRGPEMVKHLKEMGVDAPVLYVSGYAADDLPVVEKGADFLPKPYSMRELVARAQRLVLGADEASATERGPSKAAPEFLAPAGDVHAGSSRGSGNGAA